MKTLMACDPLQSPTFCHVILMMRVCVCMCVCVSMCDVCVCSLQQEIFPPVLIVPFLVFSSIDGKWVSRMPYPNCQQLSYQALAPRMAYNTYTHLLPLLLIIISQHTELILLRKKKTRQRAYSVSSSSSLFTLASSSSTNRHSPMPLPTPVLRF